jgi:uncharacterized membrane protein YfcA
MNNVLITIIFGIISGFIGGSVGLGISTLAQPGFLILGLVPNAKTAIGTALVTSPPNWLAAYTYYKAGYANIELGLIYLISFFIASYFGSKFSVKVSSEVLSYAISAIYFLIALYFLHKAMNSNKQNKT